MKTKHSILAAVMTLTTFTLSAQVRIGGDDEPATGALLDLNSTVKGGFVLSNVTITDIEKIPRGTNVFPGIDASNDDNNPSLRGAMVYNDGADPAVPEGIYVWNGNCWTQYGNSSPASLPKGSGTFTGRTRFDIAATTQSSCGTVAARTSQKTDFTDTTVEDPLTGSVTAPFSGVQVYTFTPVGTVSHVRFDYVDETGDAVDYIEPQSTYATDDNINGTACKVTVHYKSSLNTTLRERSRNNALKVKLYAIYNPVATYDASLPDRRLELDISLQDCHSCGAKGANGSWLNFMCHNLGANEGLDPFMPAAGIHGAKYKFGAKNAALSQAKDQSDAGTQSNWLGTGTYPFQNDTKDWASDNNPCPAGWRIPAKAEWQAVIDNNTKAYSQVSGTYSFTGWGLAGSGWVDNVNNYAAAVKLGESLVLPNAGLRNTDNGDLIRRGLTAYYWSSAANDYGNGIDMYVRSNGTYVGTGAHRQVGLSVRCIAAE
jgi:uncharacterized protein (TIGR02145 family)